MSPPAFFKNCACVRLFVVARAAVAAAASASAGYAVAAVVNVAGGELQLTPPLLSAKSPMP